MSDSEFEAAIEATRKRMERRTTTLLVTIEQDPLPGWGHQPEDHEKWLRQTLASQIGHYNPTVTLTTSITSLELLARLFPDPLTRPLYTVGDMEMHADRIKNLKEG